MTHHPRRYPLARTHHGLPTLVLWVVVVMAAALAALTTLGSTSAHAVTVTESTGLVSVHLDADEVRSAHADANSAEGICLADLHLAGHPCAESLRDCVDLNVRYHVPLLVTLDYAGALRGCARELP